MNAFEKKLDKIRKELEGKKAELYPIENEMLQQKDEYIKSLYIRMLCTLIRYTGEADEMQIVYIRRLHTVLR